MAHTKDLQDLKAELTKAIKDQAAKFQQELDDKDQTITCQKAEIDTLQQDYSNLQTQLLKVAPASSSIAHWVRPQPPKFVGKPSQDPVKFIRDLEKYFGDIQLKTSTWLASVPFALSDCAKSWFDANHQATFETYNTFKTEFLNYFGLALTDDERLVHIAARTQKPGESFPDYAWSIYEMFNGFSVTKSEAIRVERIIENSDPAIRIHLRTLKQSEYNMKAIVDLERKLRRDLAPNHPYLRPYLANVVSEAPSKDPTSETAPVQNVQQKKPSGTFYCHHCWKPNHYARDCADRKAGIPRTRQPPFATQPPAPQRRAPFRPQYPPRQPLYSAPPTNFNPNFRQFNPRPVAPTFNRPQYFPRPGNSRVPGRAPQAYQSYHVQPQESDSTALPALMDINMGDFMAYAPDQTSLLEMYTPPHMEPSAYSLDYSDATSQYTS